MYDLLPFPFTSDAVKHVGQRSRQVQEFLEQKITIEIVSYYTPVAAVMTELEFINAVIDEADCDLLLDVNNIYVNGFNHNYNAEKFKNSKSCIEKQHRINIRAAWPIIAPPGNTRQSPAKKKKTLAVTGNLFSTW